MKPHDNKKQHTTDVVVCNQCGKPTDLAIQQTRDLVYRQDILEAMGWVVVGNRYYCPDCIDFSSPG